MPAENALFAYGSLMFPEVWLHVVGSERPSVEATLAGHTAFVVAGHTFPGLVPMATGDITPGRLYSELTREDWRRLDAFEDTFYCREPVEIRNRLAQTHTASAYIVDPLQRGVLSDTVWRAEWFEEHALGTFLDRITGFDDC